MIKLTANQENILKIAADREQGNIEPLPNNIKGGAVNMTIKSLLNKGLAEAIDEVLTITALGRQLIDWEPSENIEVETYQPELDEPKPTPRAGSKQGILLDLMLRPEGVTIDELMELTGWQRHSICGTISRSIKKQLGYTVTSTKEGDNRVYRAA